MENRRIINSWLSDKVYGKLGDHPNIENTWAQLREVIGHYLFRAQFVPVPFIESAAYYNQLFVFSKKQTILSTLGLRPPTYKIIGNIDYMVNRNESTWIPQFDLSPWNITDGLDFTSEFGLRFMSYQKDVEKYIEFTAIQCHARNAQPPIPRAVKIHRSILKDLKGVNTIFVITDVVIASYVKLMVRIGDESLNLVYDREMPIGFKYKKFRLHNDGTVVAEIPTSLRIHADEAIWLEPLQQPIPIAQLWDQESRRYRSAVRRRKSNLTIPPQCEGPLNVSQRDGIANLQRSVENVNAIFRALNVIQHIRHNDLNEDVLQNEEVADHWSTEALRGSDDEE